MRFRSCFHSLDIGKVLNEPVVQSSEEEVFSFPSPSPFQTDLPLSQRKVPINPSHITRTKETSMTPPRREDSERYRGHSLMNRILEQEAEERKKELLSQSSECRACEIESETRGGVWGSD